MHVSRLWADMLCPQGMKVLHTLGIEMDGVGVSSSCHFSFLPDGTVSFGLLVRSEIDEMISMQRIDGRLKYAPIMQRAG